MKNLREILVSENKTADGADAARTAINDFNNDSVKGFIESLVWGIEDGLKSFKPKKEYSHITPELIDDYKKQWTDFAKYLKEFKIINN